MLEHRRRVADFYDKRQTDDDRAHQKDHEGHGTITTILTGQIDPALTAVFSNGQKTLKQRAYSTGRTAAEQSDYPWRRR